ncbi:Poly [ADP-ribose] polymerase 3 [Hypsibius exemplaris]|uniref:Poly [ADP-ribose] polymerase n=1 Tax=Hypsibius exemplaris TaxID=2072580 RepID=A0A1W0WT62_HYPEX|nr:Poly [ADP-ribose] polymerase 3 [Hypsibius exemplaris]
MPRPAKRKVAAAAKVAAVVEDVDWEAKTVVQLKAELTARNLDVTGKKAELIKRLQEDTASSPVGEATVSKKQKKDKEPPKTVIQQAIEQLKAGTSKTNAAVKVFKIDALAQSMAPGTYKQVHEDRSFMLHQTDIGNNNNKFYVGQLLERHNGTFDVFTKWGRTGEVGATLILGPSALDEAIVSFEKKFTDKTGNKWANRADFVKKAGKYNLIETDGDDAAEAEEVKVDSTTKVVGNLSAKSELDEVTRQMVSLIFDQDMFNTAMEKLNLDTKKMPLGKLSKSQIAKGFEALEKIEARIKGTATNDADDSSGTASLTDLSNAFYSIIPHDFRRMRPPTISDLTSVQEKFDMLTTLGDIEIAQQLQKQDTHAEADRHPCDIKYGLLKCKLRLLDKSSMEYKALEKYFDSTKSPGSGIKLRHIWAMDRETDDQRFKVHESIKNRKLLWHGTNVAVVAAILKTGLRIMPHSGGRVGRGIYFASEHGKSASYTRTAKGTGLMFLNEVALGQEHEIDRDDSSLVAAPSGYDSVVARGQVEPDPSYDTKLKLGGKDVVVPQGAPQRQPKYSHSSFSQSEYLVYRESQVRMRYMLDFDFNQGY